MSTEIDDFTIVLSKSTDLTTCELEIYGGLDRLWRMIERYKMTGPIAITVIDNNARRLRAIRATRDQAIGWHLGDETIAAESRLEGETEFPLTLNSQDAKGNILKMRLHFGVEVSTKRHSNEA